MKVKITYDGFDELLDSRIELAMKAGGFSFIGSGYDTNKDKRDITFEIGLVPISDGLVERRSR